MRGDSQYFIHIYTDCSSNQHRPAPLFSGSHPDTLKATHTLQWGRSRCGNDRLGMAEFVMNQSSTSQTLGWLNQVITHSSVYDSHSNMQEPFACQLLPCVPGHPLKIPLRRCCMWCHQLWTFGCWPWGCWPCEGSGLRVLGNLGLQQAGHTEATLRSNRTRTHPARRWVASVMHVITPQHAEVLAHG